MGRKRRERENNPHIPRKPFYASHSDFNRNELNNWVKSGQRMGNIDFFCNIQMAFLVNEYRRRQLKKWLGKR